MMQITIIGSGGWEGIPAPFCNCRVCKLAKENPNSKNFRTRPEILVGTHEGKFLIEVSPDIRLQSARFDLSSIRDFLISHWHFDHMYGLLELHAWSRANKIKLYCSSKTKEWLDENFSHINFEIKILKPFQPFWLYGVKVTPLPVYHMYLQDKEIEEEKLENTFGFLLERKEKKVAYLSDYFKLPRKTLYLIKNCDVIIMDGTYLFEEFFSQKFKRIVNKNDPDHLHGQQILELAKSLNSNKIVFHSITHFTEKTHDELQNLLPKNMFLSFDGMRIDL